MPRKPARRHKALSKPPHLGFSSFARFVSQVASTSMPRSRKPLSHSPGNAFDKPTLKHKIEHSDSSSEEDNAVVQVDFAFFDPKPDDFHGVKILLQTYLDTKQWDVSGFVDLILAQNMVGSVVKIEDAEDDAPFSIVTALNLGRHKDHRCIRDVKDYLLRVCQENEIRESLKTMLEEQAHTVGLLVSQRVVNLPHELLPPLYDALFDEVSWATEDEPTEELRQSFCFKFYIIVTKIYKHKSTCQRKETVKRCTDEPIIYVKAEDEIFHKLSSWSFNFALHTEHVAPEELRNYNLTGLIMAVEADKIPTFRKELQSLINGS